MKYGNIIRSIFAAIALLAASGAWADTETINGYTWTYRIIGDTAEIFNDYSCAVTPSPTGAVTIPSTLGGKPVTSIGNRAFSGCSRLASVTIPDSVTSIEYCAFSGCSGLTSVSIPDSVTSIGSSAFSGCSGLTSVTIPDGVTSIGSWAFDHCSGLTSVTIPDRVTSIGSSAFSGCSGLTSVTIPNSVTSIGSWAFDNCSGLTSVSIPDSVTSIGSSAFSGCSGLTNVTIPNSVTSIGSSAFSYCSGLASVTIPDSVTNIGSSAFYDCSGLTSVTIPDSVTSIGDSAFSGCSGLASVTIPDSVTSIGSYAFRGCSGLTSVFFGGNAPSVADWAFDCACTVYVPYGSAGWDVPIPGTWKGLKIRYLTYVTVTFDANGGTGGWSRKLVRGTAIVAPTVTKEWCNFTGWSPAVAATVPANDVTYTAQWQRYGDTISTSKICGKTMRELYPDDYMRMTTVVLEEGITELPAGFFDGCDNVEDLTLPESLREFGIDDLPPKIRASLAYDENGFMIYGNWILDYQNRSAAAVTIPDGIVGIGRGAFREMFDLETVTMPESLRCIATSAFEDCSWIQNLQFMSGLRYVGQEAFRGCASLLGASFADGVEHIGANAFKDCWQMTSVRLPYTVAYIGDGAFTGCSAIRGVTVPTHLKTMQNLFPASYSKIETAEVAEGETTVMDDMFKGCVALRGGATQTDMSMIPNTVTNIGAQAFQSCTSLTAFVVPDSVTAIGASVFQGCSSLWNVTLSRSLTEIPDYAFDGCSMLETMVVPENVNYLGNRFFSGKYRGVNALYYLCANAPDYNSGAYAAIAGNMTTYVLQDSRSWDGRQGSRVLPQSWNGYDITYWTPNRFDVTFDANGGRFDSMGGSTWSEQQITDMTYALPSTEPLRPGWAFEGWWTEQTGGAEVRYTTVVTATRTHTIYAHWRLLGNNMTVTFNSNGGTVVTPGTQDYVPGQTFGQFPVPTRRGYTFQGWWTEAVNGIRMTEATQVPAADMELFAHWKPILYYVRFHANGGTGTMSDQPFTYDVSGALKTHAFTRTGFAFTGWATTPSGQVRYAENKTVVNLEEVDGEIVDLYAVWSGVGYSVRFDSNGGTGIMENQTIAVGELQNLWPCVFARGGYTFAGWALSPADAEAKKVAYLDGAAVKDLATENGATVPLYAVWVTGSQTVRITFDANDGSVSPDYWDCVVGTAVEAFPTPTRPGYTFVGWFTAASGGTQVSNISIVTSAQTFYAHWTVDRYKVTFGKNGGTGGDNYVTATYGAAMPTPRTAPKLAGWTFAGYWDTVAVDEKGNPKGKQYYDADMKSVRAWDKKGTATLWARWTNKVTLGKNGGTGGDNYVTCTKGQPMPKRTMPTKSGYAFAGYWTTVNAGGVKYYNADGTSAHVWDKSGNVTLWAKWEKAVTVKVTLGKNGGSGGDNYVTCTTGKPMPTPRTAPKRAGWTFDGYWDTLAQDANGNPTGKQYYDKDMKSVRIWDKPSAVTLWAKWTVKVKLGKNGGTGGDDEVVVTYNQPFPKKAMPKRTGYTFGGYFVSSSKQTGQCYNADGTGTSSMKWTTGGTPTIWALWTKTGSNVVLPAASTTRATAVPAIVVAAEGPIPAGLYSGVLADGSGAFWLMLDEPEEGYDRTAYLYVVSEDDAFTAECTVEESGGLLILTTEDGETFAVDPVAGSVSSI